jgi:3-methylcrotonyl-CoA carboxylase alpha subunit
VAFLRRLAGCRAFREADLDTGLIERSREELFPSARAIPDDALAAAAFAELALEEDLARERARASGDPYSPWHRVDGWRLNLGSHHSFAFVAGGERHEASVDFDERGLRLRVAGRDYAFAGERLADGALLLRLDGRAFKARAVRAGRDWHLFMDGGQHRLALEDELHGAELDQAAASLAAPMPGKVIAVLVKAGARVEKGAPLMILEAMKMEHTITAPRDGEVKELLFAAGDLVNEGAELLKFEAAA